MVAYIHTRGYICDMIYSMEAKVGISKVEIQVKIGCGGEFFGKNELFMW